jgi:pantothenate synthetase
MRAMSDFSYFVEIENTFVLRRGEPYFLSPRDWALIENWKKRGISLDIALQGIERAFDLGEASSRTRKVNSLMYCQSEVERQFDEWNERETSVLKPET